MKKDKEQSTTKKVRKLTEAEYATYINSLKENNE